MKFPAPLAAICATLLAGCAAEGPYYGSGYYGSGDYGYYDSGPGYYGNYDSGPGYYYGPSYFSFSYRNRSSSPSYVQTQPRTSVQASPASTFRSGSNQTSRGASHRRHEERLAHERARDSARERAHVAQRHVPEREHGG